MSQKRSNLLRLAEELVNGDRQNAYGDPKQDFARTAAMWTVYLDGRSGIRPNDVAVMMILLKASRLSWMAGKEDSWVDIAGYAACGWDCVE